MSNPMQRTIDSFHCLYYGDATGGATGLHHQTTYHGIETHKCPLDLWIYQEIVHRLRPSVIVELGTYRGGSTLFLAHQLELAGHGHIVSVDCEELPRPSHERITYFRGKTADPAIVSEITSLAQESEDPCVLVIHDADHHYDAVIEDLTLYAPLVTPGCYLIVEDSNVNGHPVLEGWGPGPWEAIDDFLRQHSEFVRDETCEKFLLTYNPGGYLRRIEE